MQKMILVMLCVVELTLFGMQGASLKELSQKAHKEAPSYKDCLGKLNVLYNESLAFYDQQVLSFSCNTNNENYEKFFTIAEDRNQKLLDLLQILNKKDFLASKNKHEALSMINACATMEQSYDKVRSVLDDSNKTNPVYNILKTLRYHIQSTDADNHNNTLDNRIIGDKKNEGILSQQQKKQIGELCSYIDTMMVQWDADDHARPLIENERKKAVLYKNIMQAQTREEVYKIVKDLAVCNSLLHRIVFNCRKNHEQYMKNIDDACVEQRWNDLVNKENVLDALEKYYVYNVGVLANLEYVFTDLRSSYHYNELEEYEYEDEEEYEAGTINSYMTFFKLFSSNSSAHYEKRILQRSINPESEQDKEILGVEQEILEKEQDRNSLIIEFVKQCESAYNRTLKVLPACCSDLIKKCVKENEECYSLMRKFQDMLKQRMDDETMAIKWQSHYQELQKRLDHMKTFHTIMYNFHQKYETICKRSASSVNNSTTTKL